MTGGLKNWYEFNRNFATKSIADVEYEIDYITLKKTRKKDVTNDIVNLKMINTSVSRDVVEQSVCMNKHIDAELNTFVIKYSDELIRFRDFIRSSYDYKIKNFSQLTVIELSNCLYIFKDYYLKNKITGIDKYNYINYNYMFKEFLKLSRTCPDFPALLYQLLTIYNQGTELLNAGISNYELEIVNLGDYLACEVDQLDWNQMMKYFDDTIENYHTTLNRLSQQKQFDESFYLCLIKSTRLRGLKSILSSVKDLSVDDLTMLFKNPSFTKISDSLRLKELERQYKPNWDLIKFLVNDSDLNYYQILGVLNRIKYANQESAEVGELHDNLLSLCLSGYVDCFEEPLDFPFTRFKISDSPMLNFEFSMIFKHKVFLFIDELKVLKSMGIDLSSPEVVNVVGDLKFKSDVLTENFDLLGSTLKKFFSLLNNNKTDSLDALIVNKNWYDWCDENYHSRIPRAFIDCSNLANYPYRSIELTTELASILPGLSKFSLDNKIGLSGCSLDYLLSLFKDSFVELEQLRILYLNQGNVYLKNIDDLLNDYNVLYSNLAGVNLGKIRFQEGVPFKEFSKSQLEKHLGYYLTLIKDPVILDNLEELYKSSNITGPSVDDIKCQLKGFGYELEILKVDELQSNFSHVFPQEILSLLDRRIKEILSNLNSNPQSRLNSVNIGKFMNLNRLLISFFNAKQEPGFLDSLIEYKQIPDHFNMHDFAPDLYIINQRLGKEYKKCSMGEVLVAVNDYIETFTEESSMQYKNLVRLSVKLKQLFRLNGGFTSVLDTIISNQVQFEKFESKLQGAAPKTVADVESSTKLYTQIPEDFKIHEFAKELQTLKTFELDCKPFKNYSSEQLEEILDLRIEEFFSGCQPPNSYITSKNINVYTKLLKNIHSLFKINGNNTDVLDAIINSEMVFAKFENDKSKKVKKTKTYRQLPDDFRLQEFTTEIQHLQIELSRHSNSETFKFSDILESEILNELETMVGNERKFNLAKRENFHKLLKNLRILFNYNGDETSVLDNVLINNEVLSLFINKVKQQPKDFVEFEIKSFLKNYRTYFDYFLEHTRLANYDLVDYYDYTMEEFNRTTRKFLQQVKKEKPYEYNVYKDFVDRLLSIYSKNPVYLPVISQLSRTNGEGDLKKIECDIVEFNNRLCEGRESFASEEAEIGQFKDRVEVPVEKFDMNDFTGAKVSSDVDSVPSSGIRYTRGTEKFNVKENSMEDSELFVRNQIFHQIDTEAPLVDFDVEVPKTESLKPHKALEDKFFEPCKFDTTTSKKYLLLTMEGEKIPSNVNPFKKEDFKDVFSIFDEFTEEEIEKFINNTLKLHHKRWKLIGGGSGEHGKMLVFSKSGKSKKKGFFKRVKSVLAVTGATFMVMIGLNYVLDEPRTAPETEEKPVEMKRDVAPVEPPAAAPKPAPESAPSKPIDPAPIDVPSTVVTPAPPRTSGWFWK